MERKGIIFKGIKEFWETPTLLLIMKLTLISIVITLCILAIFLHETLLGYAMIGMGMFVLTLGIESKMKKQEKRTLIVSVIVTIVFFAISTYIFTNPFV